VRFVIKPEWGIRIMALWALMLALLALANLLLLSEAVELYSNEYGTQLQAWIVVGLNVIFGLAFGAATYGLWRHRNWGRILFLWIIVVWAVFNLIAIFMPGVFAPANQEAMPDELTINGIRFAVTLLIPVWYLNRPQIKSLFYRDAPEILEPRK
jgi:hypothetical protein